MFRLLIVDDELTSKPRLDCEKPRKEYYDELRQYFDLVYTDPKDLYSVLNKPGIDGVLLDFVLESIDSDAFTVLALLEGKYPVGLISRHWGPNFEKLRRALDEYPEVSTIFSWDDLIQPERRRLISIWMERAIRTFRGLGHIDSKPGEAIRLLHLSDLQFGSGAPDAFAAETQLMAQRIIEKWPSGPHFVAVTGDITQRGLPSEFRQASHWLLDLTKQLTPHWDGTRLLVVPGNHDVCWPLGLSARIDPGTGKLLSEHEAVNLELRSQALGPFRNFAREMKGAFDWSDSRQYFLDGRYRDLGLIFFGYNTCEELDANSVPTRNVVDKTITQVFKEVKAFKADSKSALVVGLLHHPLLGGADREDTLKESLPVFLNASGLGETVVILSGHSHDDGFHFANRSGATILEIFASTITQRERARPRDSSRGFNMISIERNAEGTPTAITVEFCRFDRSDLTVVKQVTFPRQPDGRIQY